MSDNNKQYIGHDIEALDDAGNYYSRHVNAMTAENLFLKSDIAAELGYRDKRIDELLAALEEKGQSIAELNVKLFDQSILLDAAISRAEATERREKILEGGAVVLMRHNAELEQRLQQPIKLPDIRSEDYHETGWFQHMKYYRAVVRSIQVLELKVEGE